MYSMLRFGVLFNGMRLSGGDFNEGFSNGVWFARLFSGYNFVTLLVVLNLGCTGLLVSWIMKFADNIVKVRIIMVILMLEIKIDRNGDTGKASLNDFFGFQVVHAVRLELTGSNIMEDMTIGVTGTDCD